MAPKRLEINAVIPPPKLEGRSRIRYQFRAVGVGTCPLIAFTSQANGGVGQGNLARLDVLFERLLLSHSILDRI